MEQKTKSKDNKTADAAVNQPTDSNEGIQINKIKKFYQTFKARRLEKDQKRLECCNVCRDEITLDMIKEEAVVYLFNLNKLFLHLASNK